MRVILSQQLRYCADLLSRAINCYEKGTSEKLRLMSKVSKVYSLGRVVEQMNLLIVTSEHPIMNLEGNFYSDCAN